jgi:hypothetical protein
MNRLLHHSRLTILVALLALSGLALAAGPAPAAHAGSPPRITAAGGDLYVFVTGSGFTPSSPVVIKVRIYHPITKKWSLESKSSVNASPSGTITAYLNSQPGTVHVVAYDKGSATWSNTATTKVLPLS